MRANLDTQLNAIYKVLKAKLDTPARHELVLEERKWIKDREKLEPEQQDDLASKGIDELAAGVLNSGVQK